jgi:hypothetical protein
MYTLFIDDNRQLCRVNDKLKLSALKGGALDEGKKNTLRLIIDQVKRGINPKAESLQCIDLESGQCITLGELVRKKWPKKLDFLNSSHRKRIDSYRKSGLTENQVAEAMGTNEKMLYRKYPRYKSVSTSSTGRRL